MLSEKRVSQLLASILSAWAIAISGSAADAAQPSARGIATFGTAEGVHALYGNVRLVNAPQPIPLALVSPSGATDESVLLLGGANTLAFDVALEPGAGRLTFMPSLLGTGGAGTEMVAVVDGHPPLTLACGPDDGVTAAEAVLVDEPPPTGGVVHVLLGARGGLCGLRAFKLAWTRGTGDPSPFDEEPSQVEQLQTRLNQLAEAVGTAQTELQQLALDVRQAQVASTSDSISRTAQAALGPQLDQLARATQGDADRMAQGLSQLATQDSMDDLRFRALEAAMDNGAKERDQLRARLDELEAQLLAIQQPSRPPTSSNGEVTFGNWLTSGVGKLKQPDVVFDPPIIVFDPILPENQPDPPPPFDRNSGK